MILSVFMPHEVFFSLRNMGLCDDMMEVEIMEEDKI